MRIRTTIAFILVLSLLSFGCQPKGYYDLSENQQIALTKIEGEYKCSAEIQKDYEAIELGRVDGNLWVILDYSVTNLNICNDLSKDDLRNQATKLFSDYKNLILDKFHDRITIQFYSAMGSGDKIEREICSAEFTFR